MTKAQCDLAYNLVSELSVYADAIEKYGNQNISAAMRNAASLLSQMVEEHEGAGEPVDKRQEAALREIKDQYLTPDQSSSLAKAALAPARQENDDVFPGFRGNNEG